MNVSDSHPRAVSLRIRHKLVEGYLKGLVAEEGLIAHGRGEALDYLLGEETVKEAEAAQEAAVVALLLAQKPVISVNGNAAALVPEQLVELSALTDAELEVNLFYRTPEREKKIAEALKEAGAENVLGLTKKHEIPGLGSERANVDDALWNADVVLVALEDGDRTEALRNAGKKVIAVDLNPLSRTAQQADITIVDNIVRAIPNMNEFAGRLKQKTGNELKKIIETFDNQKNLEEMEKMIRGGLG